MTRFRVTVPFDPVVHEDLDSSVFTQLPDSDLAVGLAIRGGEDSYTAQLEVDAERPGAAKHAGVEGVERFLGVLAACGTMAFRSVSLACARSASKTQDERLSSGPGPKR